LTVQVVSSFVVELHLASAWETIVWPILAF